MYKKPSFHCSKRKLSLFLLIAIIFFSCRQPPTYPKDFNFRIKYGYFLDKLSSFDSTYTKHYINSDSIIKVVFTEQEKRRIYKAFEGNGILEFPKEIGCSDDTVIIPSSNYDLTFQINGKMISIYLNGSCANYKSEKHKNRFMSSIDTIMKILSSKPRVKNLPETDLIAL